MADINSINSASQYRGTAELGGGIGTAVVLDPTPLARLATFTYYRDRDLWEKKNADDKLAAEKIAALTAFDITSPLKPFSDDLKSSLTEIQTFVRENPDSLVWSRNPEKFQKREELINAFLNKRKGATTNDALYNAQKAAIEKIADPAMKEIRRRELDNNVDKLFGEGLERAYNTQMNALPELKPSDYKVPTVGLTSRSYVDIDPNNNTEITIDYIDIDDARTKSALAVATPTETIDESLPWFQKLSEGEKQIERDKVGLSGEKRRSLQKLSSDFNSLLGQWVSANPNIDINTVDPNTLPDGTLENNVKSVLLINKQIDELNSLVKQGKIVDKNGFVREKDYEKINFQDGLSEDEVTLLASLQENGNAIIKKVAKNIQYTGDATRRQGQQLDYQAAWARSQQTTKPPDAIENPARIFGDHIDRVKKYYSNKNLKPQERLTVKYSGLDDDTRKALGIPIASDTFSYKDKFVTYNPDGSFRLGTDAKGQGGTPGTLEQLRTGFINVVKSGLDEKGVQSEGFQTNAENGFYKIFGVNNAQTIWDGWNSGGVTQSATPNQGSTTTSSSSGGRGNTGGYTDVTPANYKGKRISMGVKDGKWYNTETGEEIK